MERTTTTRTLIYFLSSCLAVLFSQTASAQQFRTPQLRFGLGAGSTAPSGSFDPGKFIAENTSTLCLLTDPDTTKKESRRSSSYSGDGRLIEAMFQDPTLAVVAGIGILSVAAIYVSNDFYVHGTYSFRHPAPRYSNNIGYAFGLRKTFEHAALEYGGSYIAFNDFSGSNPNSIFKKQQVWGAHISFVHQVFYRHTPDRLQFYIGPTVNYMSRTAGVGGIAGAQFRVFDRLKLDLRYEQTTQSQQLQAGLLFTYQKKSPWEE